MTRRISYLAVGCLAMAGCFYQKPLATIPPPPATHIIAQLSDSGTVMMGNALGPGVVAVHGVVETADRNVWMLHMVSADQRDGRTVPWNNELVSFPSRVLVQPEMRVLDKKKTWLTAIGITVGAFLASRAFNALGADENKEETPGPAAIVIGVGGK